MNLRAMVSAASAGLLTIGLSIAVAGPAHAFGATPGSYQNVSPVRVLDTRSGNGAPKAAVAPMGVVTFKIPSSIGASAAEVLLEVTAVKPTAHGYVTVYPAGSPRPAVSTINFDIGQTVPNMVVVKVGAGGQVSLFNGSMGTVNMLADVQGYFQAGANAGDPGTLVPVTPTRFLDTRIGLGAPKARAAASSVTRVQIAGRGGIPADASAVAINLAAVKPTAGGYLTAYPGSPRPVVSIVNFEAMHNRANLALVELGTDGSISIFNGSPQTIDLLADVSGYFVGGGTPQADGAFVPSSTFRVLDTRQTPGTMVSPHATRRVQIFQPGDPSSTFVKAVAVNVTAVEPGGGGYLTIWDGATAAVPAVSNVNFEPRHTTAGSIVVPLHDGAISVYNGSSSKLDLVVDFDGLFFQLPTQTTAGAHPDARRVPTAAEILQHVLRSPTAVTTAHR